MSSDVPTRGGARRRRRRVPPRCRHHHREPERLGDRTRDVLDLGVHHDEARLERLQRVGGLGFAEVRIDRCEGGAGLADAVAELERVEHRRPPPHDAVARARRPRRSGGARRGWRRRRARAKVRTSSPSVAPIRCGLTVARRVSRSWMRTSIGPGVSCGRARSGQAGWPGAREGDDYRRADVVDEASLLADVDRQLHAVVATFGEPVAGALGPIAAVRVAPSRPPGARARPPRRPRARGPAARPRSSSSTSARWCTTTSSTARPCGDTRRRCTPRSACRVALWTADALYAEALHLADAVSPAGGLALGDALRRIADSQILEALGATTARYWDVVDGKTVSLFEASFALADEAAGGALPASRARRGASVRTPVPVRRRPAGHRR